MTARRVLAALVLAAALGACGQDDPVDAAGSEELVAGVAQVSQAATAGDADALATAAGRLRALVGAKLEAGALDEARGAAVLDQLDRVLADVAAVSPTPAPTTAGPTPTTDPNDGAGDDDDKRDGDDDDKPGKKGDGRRDKDD